MIASLSFWLAVVFAALTVAGVYGIVQSHNHREMYGRKKRGVEPGQGDQYLVAGERTAFFGEGNPDASRGYRVTRDPQVYARAFVPGQRKK
jgi:hypothetical protein